MVGAGVAGKFKEGSSSDPEGEDCGEEEGFEADADGWGTEGELSLPAFGIVGPVLAPEEDTAASSPLSFSPKTSPRTKAIMTQQQPRNRTANIGFFPLSFLSSSVVNAFFFRGWGTGFVF
jgi:hypothetical protein